MRDRHTFNGTRQVRVSVYGDDIADLQNIADKAGVDTLAKAVKYLIEQHLVTQSGLGSEDATTDKR
ncbi:hypothetical protein G3R49_12280 [Shewanella sp. WXL01]|uniref:hypothetical protein n=1 Tax=Shewanella sp. WXL01 TaxID=2709721 RepID=UPI0014384865|nr:hypothetical protein [Shewanella sp. WXL01]NKF51334.1 hypothetical protein [Shewanella sp. WXL01]